MVRPALFRLGAETAHSLTIRLLQVAGIIPGATKVLREIYRGPEKPVKAFGLVFPNPVGLAAGYDKDGLGLHALAALGFGHIEVGTVTPRPQMGNPRPRIFRLVEDEALINRMGFPGRGAVSLARRLADRRTEGPVLGVNLGMNRETALEEASQDYLLLMRMFAPLADYLVVNISSPNTPGLRQLQAKHTLMAFLGLLGKERKAQEDLLGKHVPLLVKLSPDLTDRELDDALQVIVDTHMDGVIATNTTVGREGLRSPLAGQSGGLSGLPLKSRSTQMIRRIYSATGGNLPIVGVGGIMCPKDAQEKLDAGAVLIQVFTGLIYYGPSLIREILKTLDRN
jgi:dihydroorotate dehydrogenase